ncbi:MAG: hypothetical protein IKK21_01880 [Clostridia bacterium]|nr:hypothetical protein [Clostridia bacterium]
MKSKKWYRLGLSLMAAGVLMIVAALGLVLYNNWESDRAGDASETALLELESIIFNNQMGITDDAALEDGEQ